MLPRTRHLNPYIGERAWITAAVVIYLVLFNRTLPHGDAMRIVRQIEASNLIWNPNHLLFDPFGYAFARFLERIGSDAAILNGFEFISGVAAVISLLMFHSLLVRMNVTDFTTRLCAFFGAFFSASFLTVALSQYYLMIQMPFLLGALHSYLSFRDKTREGVPADRDLYTMGFLTAVATGIMFNNLLLVACCGLALMWSGPRGRAWTFSPSVKFFAASAAVGFPIFVVGYLLSGAEGGFFAWLLSYQGDSSSRLNELYGLTFTLPGIVEAGAKTGFRFGFGSLAETAGLGSILSALLFARTFEFEPNYWQIGLGVVCGLAVLAATALILAIIVGNFARQPTVRLLTAWIVAYLVFNFLWNVGDEIFWFQLVPVLWLLLVTVDASTAPKLIANPLAALRLRAGAGTRLALPALVALLATVNTINAALPAASDEFFANQRAHDALLRDGDLLVFPGWDQQQWMSVVEGSNKDVRRLILMNMAVAPDDSSENIRELPAIVRAHLAAGGRVIVARVYDVDAVLMPWYMLDEMGWPRRRIQDSLQEFCVRPLTTIDGIGFRELTSCPGPR